MTAQYITMLVSLLVDMVGDIIDSGFTNNLGIGEMCVFGIICSIHGICYTVSCYGTYVFRLTGTHAKSCLAVSTSISALLVLILFIGSGYVSSIWYIEPELESLLIRCTICLALCEIPRAMGVFFTNYMQYTFQTKLCTKLLVLFYAMMFIFDVIGLFWLKSLEVIILGTGISNLVYSIISYYASGLSKDKRVEEKVTLKSITWVMQTGFGYFIERIFSRISTMLYEIGGSYLGTYQYAVFIVVYKMINAADVVVNALQTFLTVNVRIKGDVTIRYANKLYKNVKWINIACFYTIMVLSMFAVRGEVNIKDLLIPALIICTVYITSIYYIKAYCVFLIMNDKKKFMLAGIVRLAVALVLVTLSRVIRGYGLYILSTYYTLMYLVGGTYIMWCIKKNTEKKQMGA